MFSLVNELRNTIIAGINFLYANVTHTIFYRSIFTVVLSAVVVGHAIASAPDYVQAKRAANKLFYLLKRIPLIDSYSNDGKLPVRFLYAIN